MQKGMKKLHEFESMEEFIYYVHRYMRGIRTNNSNILGEAEIHLKNDTSIVGVWKKSQGYGYIEERRSEDRIVDAEKTDPAPPISDEDYP